jgi:hypothetical protein
MASQMAADLFCGGDQHWELKLRCAYRANDGVLNPDAESHSAVAEATEQSSGAALLLKGLPWARAGAPGLAAVSALTHLACHSKAPVQDRCLALAQLAQHAAEHRGYRAAEQACLPARLVLRARES